MKRYLLCLVALTLSLAAQDRREYNLRALSPEEVDLAAAGHVRYDFLIAADDGLVDAKGRNVRAAGLAAYLKQQALAPDAFYFLWITPTSASMETLAPTLKSLADHGITKIVVRNQARPVTLGKASQPDKELAKAIQTLNGRFAGR